MLNTTVNCLHSAEFSDAGADTDYKKPTARNENAYDDRVIDQPVKKADNPFSNSDKKKYYVEKAEMQPWCSRQAI